MTQSAPAFEIVLVWTDPSNGVESLLSTADLNVRVDGETIWPVAGEFDTAVDIFADDLLAHLTEFWKPLLLRQTYPVKGTPDRPTSLRRVAERRWDELPRAIVDNEESRVSAFEDAHDLSRAFAGQFGLPPLFLMRAGQSLIVDTGDELRVVAFESARQALSATGDAIAQRLSVDAKWAALIRAWELRDEGAPDQLLAWSTSLKPSLAKELVEEGVLVAPETVQEAANDNNELRLAARMASALPEQVVREVLKLVSSFEKRDAPELDKLADAVSAHVAEGFADQRPFVQGQAAAVFLRQQLNLASVQRIDIYGLIERLGIALHSPEVTPPTLEGLSVWGVNHGPAILINTASDRLNGWGLASASARVTAAHELCHQLLDRGHALSAVDVLGSRMPNDVEARAKSFAGEFLLPGRVAADVWLRLDLPPSVENIDSCLTKLQRTYGVTRSVAAWKLDHGLRSHDIDLTYWLDSAAPNRW
ncbi:Uncharacterised protein [Brevundimonas vesicularis]|uniref:IrrE N-terminal-like domain-containing protein n=1 Tax=Brevundimonas vesicularis TaxID=41276 RepID=A0A2X1BXW5_BREVE|nr:ImmA/IrrE family metallo-endopeptidase [Brevundimonas vesicularis]SPU55614.1 Uncharacterised protein [Brevundimonas vesicularis]